MVAAALTPLAPPAAAAPVFTLTGRGFGHGIGMSQYGAQGMASTGAGFTAILARYYPGTTRALAPAPRTRVLLAEAASIPVELPAGASVLLDETFPVPLEPQPLVALLQGGAVVLQSADGTAVATGRTVRVRSPQPLRSGRWHVRGDLVLRPAGRQVRLVNDLPLDEYLRAVVPRESPSWWHPAALQAQAVAARSYALAVAKPSGDFDVYADVRSQVYGGVDAERDSTDAAVRHTAGQVLTYGGRVAATFFFSSSGGRTAARHDVWGGQPVAYLQSVADPHDRISPYFTWRPAEYTQWSLGRLLGTGPIARVDVRANPSRRVDSIAVTTRSGAVRVLSGAEVQRRLRLRSTWFRVRMVNLARVRPAGPRLVATGSAHPGGPAVLLARAADGRWTIAARGATDRAGRIRLAAPRAGVTHVRLRVAGALSAVVRAP